MSVNAVASAPPVFFPVSQREDTGRPQSHQAEGHKPAETQSDGDAGRPRELSKDEQQKARELTARDREVKAHEAAHKAAGGSLTGPAHFSYTTGPDGKRYATGGEVSIDISKVPGDPQATLIKANRIRSAALAPAAPSGQDRKVAAQAAQMAANARAEIAKQKRDGNDNAQNVSDSTQFNSQPLYDHSGSVSNASGTGNVLDDMV